MKQLSEDVDIFKNFEISDPKSQNFQNVENLKNHVFEVFGAFGEKIFFRSSKIIF